MIRQEIAKGLAIAEDVHQVGKICRVEGSGQVWKFTEREFVNDLGLNAAWNLISPPVSAYPRGTLKTGQ